MTIPIHTEHKVTLTEGQISVILNSLDYTLDRWEQTGYHCEEDQQAIDSVYKELEGTIDKYCLLYTSPSPRDS